MYKVIYNDEEYNVPQSELDKFISLSPGAKVLDMPGKTEDPVVETVIAGSNNETVATESKSDPGSSDLPKEIKKQSDEFVKRLKYIENEIKSITNGRMKVDKLDAPNRINMFNLLASEYNVELKKYEKFVNDYNKGIEVENQKILQDYRGSTGFGKDFELSQDLDINEIKKNTLNQKQKPGFWRSIWNTVSLKFPQGFVGVDLQNAGNEIDQLIKERDKLEERAARNDGVYTWNFGRSYGKRGGTRWKGSGTKEEAEQWYNERINFVSQRVVSSFLKTQEYQEQLNKWEQADLIDENGNLKINWGDIKQVTGEQLPQMLASVLFMGAPTFMQESTGVALRMLNKRAAETMGLSDQQFAALDAQERSKVIMNLISDGKTEDIWEESTRVGAQNASLDLVGSYFVIFKGLKFMPKGAMRSLLKGKVTKDIGKYVVRQGSSSVIEVATELTQELNTASATGDILTKNQLLEVGAQTLVGVGGTQIIVGGTSFAAPEIKAEVIAQFNPNSLRAITNEAKKKIKLNESLSTDQKLEILNELDAAEQIANDTDLKFLSPDQKRKVFKNLSEIQRNQSALTKLEEQLKEEKKNGENTLYTEGKIRRLERANVANNNIIKKEIRLSRYLNSGKSLGQYVNSSTTGKFANKKIIFRDTKEEMLEYLQKNDPQALEQENVKELIAGRIAGVQFGDNAYIVDSTVKRLVYQGSLTASNVVHHEALHHILDGMELSKLQEIRDTTLNFLKNSPDPELQRIYTAVSNRLGDYQNFTEAQQIQEFLTSLSDAIAGLTIDNVDKADAFTEISSIFSKNFSLTIPDVKFEIDGANVVEFIKKYNSFKGNSTFIEKLKSAIETTAQDVQVEGKTDVDKEAFASQETVISNLGQEFIQDLKEGNLTNELLAETFKSPSTTPESRFSVTEAILEHNWPVIGNALNFTPAGPYKMEDVKQAVKEQLDGVFPKMPGFSARTTPVLNNYTGDQKVTTYLSGVFRPRQAEIFERAKRMGAQVLEEVGPADTTLDTQPDLDTQTTVKTIDLAKRLYNDDQLTRAKGLIQQDNRDPDQLSYATLGNITAPITSEIFGVPAAKFTNPRSNLTKQEVINGRQAIIKNAKLILDTRPDGAISQDEAVSPRLQGTSTGLSRGVLNSPLFERQERGTKGAGLPGFIRNENATAQDVIDLVGKKGEPALPRSPQAQNIKSIIKMVDGAITNSLYRSEKPGLTPQQTTDIAAGKSEALASAADKDLINEYGLGKYDYDFTQNPERFANETVDILKAMEVPLFTQTSLKHRKITGSARNTVTDIWNKNKDLFRSDPQYSLTKWDSRSIFASNNFIRDKNKRHLGNWFYMWNKFDQILTKNPEYLPTVLYMLNAGVLERSHPHALGAELVLRHKNLKPGDKMELEHALPQHQAYKILIRAILDKELPFGQVLSAVSKNYKLIAVTKEDNKQINDYGLAQKMDLTGEWDVFSNNWYDRYVNAGLDMDNYFTIDGERFDQVFAPQQALASVNDLSTRFNEILEQSTGIESFKKFSPAKGRVRGRNKGMFNFFIPHSAEDFQGLMYALLPKGQQGNQAIEWMRENLFNPYSAAMENISRERAALMNDFNAIKKTLENIPAELKQKVGDYTNEEAVRVYIWTKQKMQIPGLTPTDQNMLIGAVNNNQKLKDFADQLIRLSKEDGYVKPDTAWNGGNIKTDLLENLQTAKRKKHLQKWNENVTAIFGEYKNGKLVGENANKLRAAMGDSYMEALENIIGRMKTGRNRTGGGDTQIDTWLDWLNNSVGAIMFVNVRSAVLQTISTVNYMNWSDNNPLLAAKAFANQKQYWTDFVKIFNSDYLKERRGGLQLNVSESEIAAMANKNGVKGVISYLLNKGFVLTRAADSFAIANGGASFFRNRTNSYVKQGLSLEQAEEKAFIDFKELTEQHQQSSRPDRISKEQAGGFGRVILAFANTPMQYTRLMKRSAQDLINGRGDWKTNVSKIVYYGAVQNFIFNALQQALFALGFDSEEEEAKVKEKYENILTSMLDSILRGTGVAGNAVMVIKNFLMDVAKRENKPKPNFQDAAWKLLDISPPLDSKITKVRAALYTLEYEGDKMIEKGISLDNPAAMASAQTISAFTNVPLDRIMRIYDNTRAAVASDTEAWQRVALLLGWSTWELGIQEDKEPVIKQRRNIKKGSNNRRKIK